MTPSQHDSRESYPARPMRFLVIDDDRMTRAMLSDMLSPFGECDEAADADTGLKMILGADDEHRRYDVAFVDLIMPGCGGKDLLRALRSAEDEMGLAGSDGTKVVMITSSRDTRSCVQAFMLGCESYVTKPFTSEQIENKLRVIGTLAMA
ncbi:response regulator [Blastopirellula sp. JC732]|uniref:Response regulator n=1 Tax=Blastopirellula sediminis TaxID=2894196 RepID=A0A9X1SER5_9BACT|nr:response regulator [Blastopirellula sediminis]MCC9609701.1 response regulator [Blastopirellula sediminis]MCC9627523.1 response regulator [Blastopirellula sediminis]